MRLHRESEPFFIFSWIHNSHLAAKNRHAVVLARKPKQKDPGTEASATGTTNIGASTQSGANSPVTRRPLSPLRA